MRLLLLAAALLSTAAAAQTPDAAPPARQQVVAVAAGVSEGGPTLRFLTGRQWHVSGPLSLGVVQRAAVSVDREAEPGDTPAFFDGGTLIYVEAGPSLRAALRADRVELAASVGAALASAAAYTVPFDAGFTVPLEVEAAVVLGRGVGLTASASRSLPLGSVWSNYERADPDYTLDNRAVTLGLRLGL